MEAGILCRRMDQGRGGLHRPTFYGGDSLVYRLDDDSRCIGRECLYHIIASLRMSPKGHNQTIRMLFLYSVVRQCGQTVRGWFRHLARLSPEANHSERMRPRRVPTVARGLGPERKGRSAEANQQPSNSFDLYITFSPSSCTLWARSSPSRGTPHRTCTAPHRNHGR